MMVLLILFAFWKVVITMLFWFIPYENFAVVPWLTPSGAGCVGQR